ncbi:4626_t:CDS:2, partial [Gigaspora rosea]
MQLAKGRKQPENDLDYIQSLVENLSHDERKELSTYLFRQLNRDVISTLPHPLLIYLLNFFDIETLCKFRQVSKAWKIRATDNALWKNQCILAGFPTTSIPSSFNYDIESSYDFFYQLYKYHFIVQNNWNKKLFTRYLILGHRENNISCIVGSELSNIFYSGSFDKTIKVWDISSQTCLKTLEGHSAGIQCLALSQSNLVSGSWDKSIIVYDVTKDYEFKHKLLGHTAGIISLEINSNETLLFSGSVDKTIRIWNINTGDRLHRLYGHDNTVGTLMLVPKPSTDDQDDQYWLVSGSNDTNIFVWDLDQLCLNQANGVKKPKIIKKLEGHARAITCLAWHKDIKKQIIDHNQRHSDDPDPIHISTMQFLSSNSSSSSPQTNNEDNENDENNENDMNENYMDLDSHTSPSNSCDQDNERTQNFNNYHYRFNSHNSLLSTNTNNAVPSTPPLSPIMQLSDSEKPLVTLPIFSSSADSTIRMWELSTGKPLLYINDHTDVVWQIQCDSSRLVSVSSDGFIKMRKWRCNHSHFENQQIGFDSLIAPGIQSCFQISCPAITLTQIDRSVTCFKMTHEWLVCGTEDGVLVAL